MWVISMGLILMRRVSAPHEFCPPQELVCAAPRQDFMRQQVSESQKHLPPRGCTGESMIESAVDYEVFPGVVVQRPQVADGMAAEKGLSEMPYFSGDPEFLHQWMRNRERLPELGAVNPILDGFVEEIIGVVVKAFYVRAGKQDHRVSGAAKIEAGCVSTVHAAEITQRNGRTRAFSLIDNSLHSQRHVARPVGR